MKDYSITAVMMSCTLYCLSCGNGKNADHEEITTDRTNMSDSVEIIYSSPEAAEASPYNEAEAYNHPLSLIETTNVYVTPVNIDDVGATASNGRIEYSVTIINMTADTLEVESLKLPDSRFKAEWTGTKRYIPNLFTGFRLLTDSAISQHDYRFIITYKGDKYTPQVFHINLHPDVNKLKELKKNTTVS